MSSRHYIVNFKKLVVLLLPVSLRQSTIVALLQVSVGGLITIYNRFITNRTSNLYKLKITGQVCYLRKMLNDAFPAGGGQITIEDGSAVGVWQFAWDKDYDPYRKYLLASDETLLWDLSAIQEGVTGFIVRVPVALKNVNNEAKMRSLLNYYKLISRSYTIIYF
ncbi:hypothetical protein [Paludibacter sp.]|uniref:hypothetical protein n=1 Tax=Paludibacter sp. TaxID=1898105 RepID=UPI001352B971|nr:hypothetical protein [Paludibacter sp.]MTK53304.1 hypothetical protein [Paludibacter sp.]